MAKMGRPRLDKTEKKSEVLTLRLTEAERRAAEKAAKREGLALAEWSRLVIARASS